MSKIRLALIAASVIALGCTTAEARGGGHGGGSHSYGSRSYSHSYRSYSSSSRSHSGDHYVHGYTRRDGAYVHGYHATNPNHTRNDNYSTRGNVNPYTGTAGTKPRDGE
jgi:hypothetical protein